MNENNMGLFDLNGSDEILKLNLFGEEAEFKTNEFAFNPKTSGDNLATTTLNPPGGRKEDPTANEYDKGQSTDVSPPGGRTEKPSAQIYDKGQSVSMSIPAGTTLDSGTYNKALSRLQQSYKETMNMMEMVNAQMEMLSNATIVPISEEEYAMNEAAEIAAEAMYNHLMDGPMFEKADKADKDEIKKITRGLVPKVAGVVRGKTDSNFVKPNLIVRTLVDIPFSGHKALHAVWTNRLWQIIGVVYSERDNMSELVLELNKQFKDELGGFSILANKMHKGIVDKFRLKFNWKNAKCAWTLVVDNKLSGEFKAAEKEEASAPPADDKKDDSAGDSKDDAKTESTDTTTEPVVEGATENLEEAGRMQCNCAKEDHVVRNHKTQCKKCGRLIRGDKSRLIGEGGEVEYESTGMDFDTDMSMVFENTTAMKMVLGVLPADFASRTSIKADELTQENYTDLNGAMKTLKESVKVHQLKKTGDKAVITLSVKA